MKLFGVDSPLHTYIFVYLQINVRMRNTNTIEDSSWIFTLFGTAVGAGILFLPIQTGIGGFYVIVTTSVLSYFIAYYSHRNFAWIVSKTPSNIDYTGAVRLFLGNKTGSVLSILYVVLLLSLMIAYSIGLNNDVGKFLIKEGITSSDLARTPYLSLIILVVFIALLKYGKKFLIKVLGVLSIILILLLLSISLLLIEMWDFEYVFELPPFRVFLKQFFLTLPLMILTFLFFSSIPPMLADLRSKSITPDIVQKRYSGIIKTTVNLLLLFILLFVFSCIFSLKPDELKYAHQENITVMALLGEVGNKPFLKEFGPAISFFALTTSFFGVALGLEESSLELLRSSFKNRDSRKAVNISELIFYPITILILYLTTSANLNVIELFSELIAPFISMYLFFIPVIIIFRHVAFKEYRSFGKVLIFVSGVLLFVSYYIGKLI